MSARRQPAPEFIPDLQRSTRPVTSGEYRIISEGRRRSATTSNVVRPELRRTSSASLPAVRAPDSVTSGTPAGPRRYNAVQMPAVAPPLSSSGELDDPDFDFDFDIHAEGALDFDNLPSVKRVETPRPSTIDGAPPARPSGELALPASRKTPAPMPRMTPGPMLPDASACPMSGSTHRRSSSTMAAVAPQRRSSSTMAAVNPQRRSSSTMAAVDPQRRSSSTMTAVDPQRSSSSTMTAPVDPYTALVAFSGFGAPPESLWGAPGYAARVILRRPALRRDLTLARLRHSHDVDIYEAALRTADDGAVRKGLLFALVFVTLTTLLVGSVVRVLSGTLPIPW